RGKGAEMGASFGAGASQTLFGASGGGNFFSKLTGIFAFVFFVTSFSLAIMAKQKGEGGIDDDLPTVIEAEAPAKPAADDDEIPEAGSEEADADIPEASGAGDEIPDAANDDGAAESSDIPEEQ